MIGLVIILAFLLMMLLLTILWLWMFIDMLRNKAITPALKVVWALGFIFLSLVATAVYYFGEYKEKKLPPTSA